MRNYGFDYLAEKVTIFTEMAKPTYWEKPFPNFNNQIYKPVIGLVTDPEYGAVGQSSAREKTIEYLLSSLLEDLGIGGNFSDYVKKVSKTGPGKNYTDGFTKWLTVDNNWKWSPQKEKEYGVYTLVKKYKDKILEPNFVKKIVDGERIKTYLDDLGSEKVKNTEVNDYEDIEYILQKSGSDGIKKAQERLKLFLQGRNKLTPEDIRYIKSNSFAGSDGMSLDENDIRDLINQQNTETPEQKFKTFGRRIPKTSHAAQIYDQKLRDRLGGVSRQEFDYVYSKVRPLLKQIRKMNTLAKKGGLSNKSIDSPEKEFADNIDSELAHIMQVKTNPNSAKTSLEKKLAVHPQLTDELLGDLMDFVSGEEGTTKEAFAEQISSYGSKDITAFGNYLIQQAKKKVSDNTENESSQYDGYNDDVLNRVLDTPEKKEIFQQWYNLSRKEKERLKSSQYSKSSTESVPSEDSDDVVQENCVLDYMSEQIRKDSHIHQIGEYKERGFKRRDKYSYWAV